MRKSSTWWLYKLFIIFLMLTSFHAWMFWSWNSNIFFWLFVSMVSTFIYLGNRKWYKHTNLKNEIVWFIILQMTLVLTAFGLNFAGTVYLLIPSWTVFPVLMLKDEYKTDLFSTTYIGIASILTISLVGWFLFLGGVSLPYEMVEYGVDDLYYFENYHLFLRNTTMLSGLLLFPRFSSIFLEPGYLGCMVSLLLFIHRYKKGFWTIVLLITQFLTFSVAGWLISIFGYIALRSSNSKHRFLIITSILAVFFMIWWGAKTINDGNNMVNIAFFERISFDSSKGTIVGYDRSTEQTDEWFWSSFVMSPNNLYGEPDAVDRLAINDNDWKSYIIRHGLVGFGAFLLFALYPYFSVPKGKRHSRIPVLTLCIMYCLIFAQTIHMIFSVMYLVFLSLGVSIVREQDETNNIILNKSVKNGQDYL